MKKRVSFIVLLALLVSLLAACAKTSDTRTVVLPGGSGSAETKAAEESKAMETTKAAFESETEAAGASQKKLPKSDNTGLYDDFEGIVFGFLSGVGAWETTLEIRADGSFTGQFYDMNMGETGEGFDNGTLYECAFSGKLSEPVQKDEKTYTATVKELVFDMSSFDGTDSYIDSGGTKHIAADSYGIGKGDKLIIYGPETRLNETTEGFQQWVYWEYYGKPEDTKLGQYGIYNETQDTGFYPDSYAMGDAAEQGELYEAVKNAYDNQSIPDEIMLATIPTVETAVADAYKSVTIKNLQGTWKNEYDENGRHVINILQINGELGKIETYVDGEPSYGWNGEGNVTIEDRSYKKVCPAFRINDEDGSNICTIYIRWVKDDSFYDGGFCEEWTRVDVDEESYLIDTVTMDNLQGVWYSEYVDGAGFYRDVLVIENDQAKLFETLNGEPDKYWNIKGSAALTAGTIIRGKTYPELLIKDEADDNATAGIYISCVIPDESFFDQGFCRYWLKVSRDIKPYWGDHD